MEIIETTDINYWNTFAHHIKVRLQTFGQFKEHCYYFFERPVVTDEMQDMVENPKMKVDADQVAMRLPKCIALLDHLTDEQWTLDTIKEELLSFIKALSLKNGQVLWPIRCMLT